MFRIKQIVALIFVLVSCVSCDQATKSMAQTHLSATQSLSFLDGSVLFHYAENSGAFLSLGAGLPDVVRQWIFVFMVAALLGGMLLFVIKSARQLSTGMLIAFVLLFAGGVSNLIDRVLNEGRVVDFVSIGIGPLRTGIFNVADVYIMAGVFLLVLLSIFEKRPETRTWPE
jgi:signal peptidase II